MRAERKVYFPVVHFAGSGYQHNIRSQFSSHLLLIIDVYLLQVVVVGEEEVEDEGAMVMTDEGAMVMIDATTRTGEDQPIG